jgi:hypothetical protein
MGVFVRRPDFEIRPRQDYFESGSGFVLREGSTTWASENRELWQATLVSRDRQPGAFEKSNVAILLKDRKQGKHA